MMKRILFTAFLLLFCLFFSAVTSVADRLLTDQLARQVSIPDDPRRVVSLAPSITEIIFALQKGHLVRGATLYSDYPAEARNLPRVGSYVALDLEKIVALKPDLCIATKDGNPRQTINRLEALGIPVYAVNPRNLSSVMDSILAIGNLLHADQRAETLVQKMRFRIRKVKATVAKASSRPAVFFQIGVSPIVAVGTQTAIHELILLAGGKNLTAGKTPYPRFDREEIILLAPEIIIVTTMARGLSEEQVIAEWNRWPQIPAVRNGRVHIADSDLFDRPSLRLVDGLETLVKLIHPELSEGTPVR